MLISGRLDLHIICREGLPGDDKYTGNCFSSGSVFSIKMQWRLVYVEMFIHKSTAYVILQSLLFIETLDIEADLLSCVRIKWLHEVVNTEKQQL